MDMFDGAIQHQQAIFMFKTRPSLRRSLDCLFYDGGVFRMNPLENEFYRWCRGSGVLEDSKGFL
jgi:hypothetical protein